MSATSCQNPVIPIGRRCIYACSDELNFFCQIWQKPEDQLEVNEGVKGILPLKLFICFFNSMVLVLCGSKCCGTQLECVRAYIVGGAAITTIEY